MIVRKTLKYILFTREGMNNLLLVDGEDDAYTYIPMNTFTTVDLGCERGNNLTNMVTRMENPASAEFLRMFDSVWNDEDKLTDVTEEVIEMISTVYQENAPELVYFMTLYNIFSEFLEDISEDVLPNEATGFKVSVIWNKLFNFQKDAALAIINKLEQYNGCILADSVGLGKTFTALAVIKYYEGRNKNVLVLCPKKLSENWMTYRGNLINNPLATDRLRYDILYHTDLSRDSGNTVIGLPMVYTLTQTTGMGAGLPDLTVTSANNVYKYVLKGLDKYGVFEGHQGEWEYFVSETRQNAYTTVFKDENDERLDGATSARNGGTIENRLITVSLPATGGRGTTTIYIAGAALVLQAILGFILLRKARKELTRVCF